MSVYETGLFGYNRISDVSVKSNVAVKDIIILKLNRSLDLHNDDFLLALEKWTPFSSTVPTSLSVPLTMPLTLRSRRGGNKNTVSVAKSPDNNSDAPSSDVLSVPAARGVEAVFASLLRAEGICLYLDTTATLAYAGIGGDSQSQPPSNSNSNSNSKEEAKATRQQKFAYIRRLVASLGVVTLRQDKPFSLKTLSPTRTGYSPTLKNSAHIDRLLQLLERLEAGSSGDFLWSFYQHLIRRTPHPSCVVIVSDFLDPLWEEALRLLSQYSVPYSDVVLLQVLHPDEQDVLQNRARPIVSGLSWFNPVTQTTRPIVQDGLPSLLPHLPPREIKAVQAFLHRIRAQQEREQESEREQEQESEREQEKKSPKITLVSLTTDQPFEKYLLDVLKSFDNTPKTTVIKP